LSGSVLHNSLLHLLFKNGDFLNTDISQGSVATRLGCIVYKFPAESNSERILKIGQYLVKLWATVRCLVFLTHNVLRNAVLLIKELLEVKASILSFALPTLKIQLTY